MKNQTKIVKWLQSFLISFHIRPSMMISLSLVSSFSSVLPQSVCTFWNRKLNSYMINTVIILSMELGRDLT